MISIKLRAAAALDARREDHTGDDEYPTVRFFFLNQVVVGA